MLEVYSNYRAIALHRPGSQVEEGFHFRENVEGLLQVRGLYMSEERKMELHQSVVVKGELSIKAKLSIYWLMYVPALTYGHKLWNNLFN